MPAWQGHLGTAGMLTPWPSAVHRKLVEHTGDEGQLGALKKALRQVFGGLRAVLSKQHPCSGPSSGLGSLPNTPPPPPPVIHSDPDIGGNQHGAGESLLSEGQAGETESLLENHTVG